MAPIAETAIAVAEKAAEVVKESAKVTLKASVKEATNKTPEIAKKVTSYANQYLSGERTSILKKIESAKTNPETRRALFNDMFSDGKLKGTFNELERIADYKPHCSELHAEVPYEKNRIDINAKTKTPINFTELRFDKRRGIYTKNFKIPREKWFSCECKDGKLAYLMGDKKHILGQTLAGKELSGDFSLLQITPKNFEELKKLEFAIQEEFLKPYTDAGVRVIIDGTPDKERIMAVREALKTKTLSI